MVKWAEYADGAAVSENVFRVLAQYAPTGTLDVFASDQHNSYLKLYQSYLDHVGEDRDSTDDDVREICGSMAIIDGGRVLLTGEPGKLIAGLEGRIWSGTAETNEEDFLQSSLTVVSTRKLGSRTVFRVYSEVPPGDGFEPAEPDLEDVYFSTLRREQTGGYCQLEAVCAPRGG